MAKEKKISRKKSMSQIHDHLRSFKIILDHIYFLFIYLLKQAARTVGPLKAEQII
jgi:hypothetical protein